ncbi:MAG: response regulator [Acidobacteria bacterium]|nr:MAG: response regulator [Acidobacteriota bacterium]
MADRDITEPFESKVETRGLELALFSRVAIFSELTAWLAHELNQPVAAILNNAQAARRMLERGAPDPKEMREIFDDIIADSQRTAEVIGGTRSKLQKGVPERQSLLLNDLLNEVIAIVRNDPLVRNTPIDLDLGSSLSPIEGDRVQLELAMLNLIVNGFDAMQASGQPGRLTLRTREVDRAVVLDVVDSGTGILQQKLDSIFNPLVTTKADGLGMGLPVSRSIVIGHNGRLWAENNPDRGATFHMAVPVEKSLSPEETVAVDQSSRSGVGVGSPGLTVLIADDKRSFRRAVSSLLKELPELRLSVEAEDGTEALEQAARLKPDLVLLDVGLPKINGVEAAAEIRAVAPNAKIMFLTQHESPDFVSAAIRAGALGYVLKVDAGSELLPAAMAVLRGQQYLSSGVRRCLSDGSEKVREKPIDPHFDPKA